MVRIVPWVGKALACCGGLLDLQCRWWWISFGFDLGVGVIWPWVCDL
jgi:hypothetical protein